MVGRSYEASNLPPRRPVAGTVVLEAKELWGAHSPVPNSFALRKGEILGWYGLVGAGRTELARVLVGADPARGGTVKLRGNPVRISSPRQALHHHRIGYVSENRQEEGLFLAHNIAANVAATTWSRLRTRLGLLSGKAEARLAERFRATWRSACNRHGREFGDLSGGNQQKVSVAKWLAFEPDLLIFDEPTVGIDVATKVQIHELIYQLADWVSRSC